MNTKKLVIVEPNEVSEIWRGEVADLPMEVIKNNIPFDNSDDADEPGYPHVGNAAAIHAALLGNGVDTVAGWDDDKDGDACWFEFRELDPDMDGDE